MHDNEGWQRVVIENVEPEINGGRFPIKRTDGEEVTVEADIFADGHDVLSARLLYRKEGATRWNEVHMQPLVNDRWRASFQVTEMGRYAYTLQGWVDEFESWRSDLRKKVEGGQDVSVDLPRGAELIDSAGRRASASHARQMDEWSRRLRATGAQNDDKIELALSDQVAALMGRYSDRTHATSYPRELEVIVGRQKERFSTWYEMFPRSCPGKKRKHGTFKDCEAFLPYISQMGFDVLYLPPIHPIGHTNRKGRNNVPSSGPEEPGTPWAIGSEAGGHKAVNPDLGSLAHFRELAAKARDLGMEVALDIAFQCSPDHPYVRKHPQWFRRRADGTVQYAENPPKKYQDIYPLNFDTEDRPALWEELRSVVYFWIEQGVSIFRVDNPHSKPFDFWEWLIGDVRGTNPDVIFLSEAFTRPKVMYRLAKLGFTQSYTYFTWRNTKRELTEYFTELTQTEVKEFFRPNLFTNTPDILHEYLQTGGRPAFMSRLVLAATLGASYGIYGPAFELCENRPREAGSEEYLDSEKYEIRDWDIDRADSLRDFIGRVNRIRHDNPALQGNNGLCFHSVDNDNLICYSKRTRDGSNVILVLVDLDYRWKQSGWVTLSMDELGLVERAEYEVSDILNGIWYQWQGPRNYVELDPRVCPAHIFRIDARGAVTRDPASQVGIVSS